MIECPWNCKKYKAATENVFHLYTENAKLKRQARRSDDNFDKLLTLSQEYQLLGVEKRVFRGCEETLVAVITRESEVIFTETRTLRLFKLPYIRPESAVSVMDVSFHPNCTAYLENWHAVRYENTTEQPKYGGRLMRYLLTYLRTAGFWTLKGKISYVDYDHLEQLKAIYSHYGFELAEKRDRYDLHLNLLGEAKPLLTKDGYTACCRSCTYDMLKHEMILKQESAKAVSDP